VEKTLGWPTYKAFLFPISPIWTIASICIGMERMSIFFKVEAGSEDIRNSGSWKLDPKSSVPRIVFRGFILPPRLSAAWRNDTNLTIDKPMDWSTTIESSRSEIRIIVNDDLNQYYSKAR